MAAESKKRKTDVVKRYVPPELVGEILLYLPCKSLDRFKCVSKLFASFLHDFQFISEHRERNMKPSHYLSWDTSDKTKLHVFSLSRDEYRHVKTIATQKYRVVLPSSYGLVCIHGYDSRSIALLNPVSGKLVSVLPDLPGPYAFETKNQPGIAPPTTWRTNNTGFGFDPKSRKYKIVQFVRSLYTYIRRCYVLTVDNGGRTSSWREIDVSNLPMADIYLLHWPPIYVDGVLYWEMVGRRDRTVPIDVFALDLSTEKIRVIESKSRFIGYGLGRHLTALEGKLCCIDIAPQAGTMLAMEIWKLGFDGNNISWILSYKLDLYDYSRFLYPLYVDDEKRIVCERSGDLQRYDIHSKSWEIYPVRERVEGVAYSAARPNLSTIHSETVAPVPLPL